jgi:hypothetical protein
VLKLGALGNCGTLDLAGLGGIASGVTLLGREHLCVGLGITAGGNSCCLSNFGICETVANNGAMCQAEVLLTKVLIKEEGWGGLEVKVWMTITSGNVSVEGGWGTLDGNVSILGICICRCRGCAVLGCDSHCR